MISMGSYCDFRSLEIDEIAKTLMLLFSISKLPPRRNSLDVHCAKNVFVSKFISGNSLTYIRIKEDKLIRSPSITSNIKVNSSFAFVLSADFPIRPWCGL